MRSLLFTFFGLISFTFAVAAQRAVHAAEPEPSKVSSARKELPQRLPYRASITNGPMTFSQNVLHPMATNSIPTGSRILPARILSSSCSGVSPNSGSKRNGKIGSRIESVQTRALRR